MLNILELKNLVILDKIQIENESFFAFKRYTKKKGKIKRNYHTNQNIHYSGEPPESLEGKKEGKTFLGLLREYRTTERGEKSERIQ